MCKQLKPVLFLFLLSVSSSIYSQCITLTPSPRVVNLACGVNCSNLTVNVPDLRSTEDYQVLNIPYQPYSFTTVGTQLTALYVDDKFSDNISLGFPFCFYGQTQTACVIGSNSVITFDTLVNRNCANAWKLGTGGNRESTIVATPIPFTGSQTCATVAVPKYPLKSIMAAYQDIDPSKNAAVRRIDYRVEGTSPCRRFIVNYYQIPLYDENNKIFTGQIVLYESTGIIDIFFQNKPVCTGADPWNGGFAILGVQKDDVTYRDVAGKNCTKWAEQNTGYRFMPHGNTPLLQSVQYIRNGTFLGNGTVGTSTNGLTSVTFNNYCAVSNNDTILVRALYKSCSDPDGFLTAEDTIFVKKNPGDLLATAAASPAVCTAANGSITVTVPPGAGTPAFQYQVDGGPFQASNVFNGLAAGPHVIFVKDATGSCTSTINITIGITNPLTATSTTTATSCPGATNGSITVTANGTAPYQYALNGGTPQTSNTFSGLAAGTYSVTVSDGNGCNTLIFATVNSGAGLSASASVTNTSCATATNGSINITVSAGTPPYQYSLNGGTPQSSGSFSGLAPGSYTVTVTDGSTCTQTMTVNVSAGAGISATTTNTTPTCATATNGVITVNASNGQVPYQYSINGGTPQAPNTFSGLAPGTYSITVTDAANCSRTISVTLNAGAGVSATTTNTAPTCATATNGVITVNASNGQVPYQYSINGGTPQAPNTFSGLAPGTYSITVTDAANCSRTISVTLNPGAGITATATAVGTSCATATNGSITVTPANGQSPFQYSLNGGTPQAGNTFTNLAAGTYTVGVTDAANCTATISTTVGSGTGFTATTTTTPATCAVAVNGTITVSASGGSTPYTYSLNGGTPQSSPTFTGVAAGPHNITITDAANCTTTTSATVGVGAGITATAATTPTSCNGATNGTVTLTPGGGQAPYQYQLGAGPFQPSNTFTGLAAGSHSFTVRDQNGCTVTISATIAQGSNLNGSAAVVNVTCNGASNGSVTLTPANGNSPYQYSLNGGPTQPSNTFSGLAAGSYTVQFTDANNCNGTITFNVGQPAVLNLAPVATPVLCNGQSNGVITVTGSGGTTPYEYSLTGAGYQPSNTFNVAAGIYTVYIRDANGCTRNTTVTVSEPAVLQATATTTNGTCNGGANGTITASATGGTGAYQYSINATSYQASPNFNVAPGSYTVTVKDANGCTTTAPAVVGLNDDLVLSTRTDTAVCEGQPVTLLTNSNATSFSWTPTAGLNDPAAKSPVATPALTTQYIVTATHGVCTKKDTVVVQVNTAPIADAGPGTTICYGKTYQLQGSGGSVYTWRPASLLDNPNIPNPIAAPRVTTIFYLKVKDAIGCESLTEDTVKVIITPPIAAYAGPDTTVIYGEPYQLQASGGSIYSWSPSFGLSNASIANPVATLFADQTYQVEVSTPEGCKGSATVRLKVYKGPEIYVPTGFTPNGDGRNDYFRVVPVGIKTFKYLRVHNRWGQVVFETKLPDIGWDGRLQSLDQPTGTYVYTVQGVTADGRAITKKGTFILLR